MAEAIHVGVVVAHPDDETLWAGGTLLMHPEWECFVAGLCRASDADRAPRFRRAVECLGAAGGLADLDDGPEQAPLPEGEVEAAILCLLPRCRYDLLLTHAPWGEYTRHRRHEEASRAVLRLWRSGRLSAGAVWLFAYEDGARRYLPRADARAGWRQTLPEAVWQRKHHLITDIYGFAPESWEARSTPAEEAFWTLASPAEDLPSPSGT